MPKKRRYSRIAITLPEEELAAADRIAGEQDRSRSWVIAEAVRRFAAERASSRQATVAVSPGLGASRREQLRADLRLTPEQRVSAAEETARVSTLLRPPARQVVAFERYEDYLAWKKWQDAGV